MSSLPESTVQVISNPYKEVFRVSVQPSSVTISMPRGPGGKEPTGLLSGLTLDLLMDPGSMEAGTGKH